MYTFDMTSKGILFNAEVSAETLNILENIYARTNEKCRQTYDSGRLENSLFCCFFDEGFFVYSFFNIGSGGTVSMKGIFVPKEYRRTAWRIYLRDIMYMVAADEFRNSRVYEYKVDYEWICNISQHARKSLDDDYAAKIDRFFDDMQREIPHNFALTDYPMRKLPIAFKMESKGANIYDENFEEGKIIMQEADIKKALAEISENEPYLSSIYLARTSKKHFIEMKKEELKLMGLKKNAVKTESEEIEAELKNTPGENIWFVLDNSEGGSFSQHFDTNTLKDLESGSINFATLSTAVKIACNKLKDRKSGAESSDSPQSAEGKKKGGFLGSFFGKK